MQRILYFGTFVRKGTTEEFASVTRPDGMVVVPPNDAGLEGADWAIWDGTRGRTLVVTPQLETRARLLVMGGGAA